MQEHMTAVGSDLHTYGWEMLPPHPPAVLKSALQMLICSQLNRDHPIGKHFSSTEEVFTDVTQVITRINKKDLLTGIKGLLQRWEAVIRQNRDYIEGM
jgi:hypothetical protein